MIFRCRGLVRRCGVALLPTLELRPPRERGVWGALVAGLCEAGLCGTLGASEGRAVAASGAGAGSDGAREAPWKCELTCSFLVWFGFPLPVLLGSQPSTPATGAAADAARSWGEKGAAGASEAREVGREAERLLRDFPCPSRPKGAESRVERSRLMPRRPDLGVINGVRGVLGVAQGDDPRRSLTKQGMLVWNMACW
mmetsp:Transcript_115707/g.338427  ORF Transcript_115707/g.338427 Transcript_115707/m.338427 type:complete len:197 (+) Transcript_115707:304-894(+)